MVHWAKQKRNIKSIRLKKTQVLCISLPDRHILSRLGVLNEQVDIMLYQFHRVHPVAGPSQGMGVPAGSRADLQNPHSGFQIFFNISHGGKVFYRAVPGQQAAFLIIAAVIIGQCLKYLHIPFLPNKNKRCKQAAYTA